MLEFRAEEMLMFSAVDMCVGLLGALLLTVVGFLSVRKASTGGGMMVGFAGLILLLTGCCAYWQSIFMNATGELPPMPMLDTLSLIVGGLGKLLGYALVLGGTIAAANQLKKLRSES